MSNALGLFRLQQVDSRIGQVETKLGKIRDILENDQAIQILLEKVNSAEIKLRENEHARLMSEEDAREKRIKIQQVESQLYGGSVHNPKELLDLQADIGSLKKQLTMIEDLELDAMVKVEAAQADLQTFQEGLSQARDQQSNENKKLIAEQESLLHDLAILQSEREATIGPVEPGILNIYESLRKQKRGLAVAEISENACLACGATLNAGLQQNARHAVELVLCPSCGRILFAG